MRLFAISKRLWLIGTVVLCLLAAGCKPKEQTPSSQEGNEIGLTVMGLNYSGIPIGVFFVNDQWAGNAQTYAGGRSIATSIGVPKIWHPGLKVTIKWQNDELYKKDHDAMVTTEVPIPKYEPFLGGSFYVAFLPGDQIKVFASPVSPGHPDFPDPDLINPQDYCLIRPECHDEYYPGRRVPEEWEYRSPYRIMDPSNEKEKQEAIARLNEWKKKRGITP
jgi:hypothetical protein